MHEKLTIKIVPDLETNTINVAVSVMEIDIWLACFNDYKTAEEFINVMFDKLNNTAKFVCEYTINKQV